MKCIVMTLIFLKQHRLYCIVKDSPYKSFDLRRGGGGGGWVHANNFGKLDLRYELTFLGWFWARSKNKEMEL